MTSRHSIACSSSHLRNLKVCCAQKMASDVFILNLQTDWNTTPKNPKSVSPLDQVYYPRHHPGQHWSDQGFRGWCSARIHNMVPSNADLFMATNQEEGGRQEDLQPCWSLPKIQSYENRSLQVISMVQSASFVKNGKWKNLEEFKSTPFCSLHSFGLT